MASTDSSPRKGDARYINGFTSVDISLQIEDDSSSEDIALNMENTVSVTKLVAPDGGFGWVVAVASFAITFLLTGFSRSASKFGPWVREEFPESSSSEFGWVFGLIGTLSLLVSPATAMLVAEYGFRAVMISGGTLCSLGLYCSYFAPSVGFLVGSVGVPLGVGSSFIITTAVGCVGKYFTTKRAAAITLALSGGCVGAFVTPLAIEAILSAVGLRFSFLVVGTLFLSIPLLGLLFGPPESRFVSVTEEVVAPATAPEVQVLSEEQVKGPLRRFVAKVIEKLGFDFLKNPEFVLLAACFMAIQFGNPGFRSNVADQGKALGAAPEVVAQYATFLAVGDLLARVAFGFLSARSKVIRDLELWIPALLSGFSVILVPLCSANWQIVALATLASCGTSVLTICTPLVLSSNHAAANLTKTFGLARMMQAIASLIGRPLLGLVKASGGSSFALVYSGCWLILAGVMAIVLWLIRRRRMNAART